MNGATSTTAGGLGAYRLELVGEPTPDHRKVVFDLLEEYNAEQVGAEPEVPLAILVRGEDPDVVVGGLWGLSYYKWLFVELLFVPAQLRHTGLGTRLIRAAEREAARRGCHGVWLDTFTFQARAFYEKLGYAVFAEIPDYPPGHARYFLRRRLDPSGAGAAPDPN